MGFISQQAPLVIKFWNYNYQVLLRLLYGSEAAQVGVIQTRYPLELVFMLR